MGADIHMYVEYKHKDRDDNYWQSFGGDMNLDRNYFMFGILAEVRCDPKFSFKPRGIPETTGYIAKGKSRLYISESGKGEGETTIDKALQWEKSGYKITRNKEGAPTWVDHPDWHSHSWLTAAEFKQAVEYYNNNEEIQLHHIAPDYEAVLSAMTKFVELGYDCRIVFWFDN